MNGCGSWRVWILKRHLQHLSLSLGNMSASNSPSPHTAGIIVIGDEMLKGQVCDTNSNFIAKRLHFLGVTVKKISIIPDRLESIAYEIGEFSRNCSFVITTGGIGPTHDDITFQGVALAFKEPLEPHPELVQICSKYFGTNDIDSPQLKMAIVPKSANLHFGVDSVTGIRTFYPIVQVQNVYIFPGIPKLMEKSFLQLEHFFANPSERFYTEVLYLKSDEISIAKILTAASEKFSPDITIGSYPMAIYNNYYSVKITLESKSRDILEASKKELLLNVPLQKIVKFDPNPFVDAYKKMEEVLAVDAEFSSKLQQSMNVLEKTLQRYKLDEICVGFNGGKDCTVLLHLVHATFQRLNLKARIKCLCIRQGQTFPELELFISQTFRNYELDMQYFEGTIQDSLHRLKTSSPQVKAVIMGTRKSDPNAEDLRNFSETDKSWPYYMRVNCILDWSYHDIWHFIRSLSLPYCSLYDRGYTSLGSMENTHPNPKLQFLTKDGLIAYEPAYKLRDSNSERHGRN